MRKRLISLIAILSLVFSIIPSSIVQAGNYGNITEEAFVNKINSLKSTFVHGKYWNKYNGSLERTGDISCPCGYSTCPGWDNCSCGAFVYNGVEKAWQCHGYALKMGNLIFGGNPNNWGKVYNVNNVCAGDIARLDNDGHSIFIYKVDGNNIYYTDCNSIGRCKVNWNGHMTKSTLKNRLSWIYHLSGNSLKGIVSNPIQPIHKDNNPHVRNGFFTFKNSSSGTFMNVWGGGDTNGTAITTYTFDDSIDQRFNVVHKGNGKYKIYAECSSDGTNRVVDVLRNNAALAEGQKVDLYDPNDDTAQLFYIWPIGNNEYVFETASKDGYCIAPPSGLAGANNKNSQLTLQKYTGASHQKWKLCNNNGKETTANVSYAAGSYKVDTNGDPVNMRSGAGTSHNRVGSVPDKVTLRITQVNGNWGYTSYNGTNGWVCLDFMVYTVTMDSISISKQPTKTSYFVGDNFDSTGLEISANYSNGQKELIGSGYSVDCDLNSSGAKTANVTYNGKSTSFTVNVEDLEVNSISLYDTNITKEYHVGDSLISEEIGILVNYSNGVENLIKNGFTADYDFSTRGTKTVTISYGGKSTKYDVEVLENTSSNNPKIEISSEKCYSGSSAIVDIKLKSKDVYDGNMTIEYDADNLKLVSVEACGALSDRQVTINPEYSENQIRISFSGTTPVISNDAILKIKFTAFNNAEGTANISVTETKMYDKTGNPITTYAYDGKIDVTNVVYSAEVTNVQSVSLNGRKIVTANVSSDRVVCYLVSYKNGQLVECDRQYPVNGSVELSIEDIPNAQFKFMVWNEAMKPMIEAMNIY